MDQILYLCLLDMIYFIFQNMKDIIKDITFFFSGFTMSQKTNEYFQMD